MVLLSSDLALVDLGNPTRVANRNCVLWYAETSFDGPTRLQCRSLGYREKLVLEAWKQTVAVQMHFNDLELRIRNYTLTLLLAAGGAASISLKEEIYFRVPGEDVQRHISVLLLSFGLLGWLGFYLMDRFWYHRLLYGAVRHGQFIEERFGDELSFLRLTRAIGDESSIWFLGVRIRSPRKIDAFYGLFALLLLAAIYVVYNAKSKGV